MRSQKVILIVLLVGLAIFVISLVLGRPWWQALLFGVGFLVIAAIVSTPGLLIPEKLFDRGSSDKSPEATGKGGFLERMDSDLDELSAQPDAKVEDITWMTGYTRVMKGVAELVYEVHDSVSSRDTKRELQAFREVGKRLPHFISDLKSIPEPVTSKMRRLNRRRIEGMDLYLLACSNFAEALEKGDGDLAGQAAMQINKALDLLDIMGESLTASMRRPQPQPDTTTDN